MGPPATRSELLAARQRRRRVYSDLAMGSEPRGDGGEPRGDGGELAIAS
jgi:hypothetical protein